jgi:hypothetical protein
MFRKILIILLVLSPLFYTLFIGYPVVSQKEYQERQIAKPGMVISKRCFAVGDFREFRNCFSDHEKIKGISYFAEVLEDMDRISPLFTFIFIVGLTLFIYISIFIMWSI